MYKICYWDNESGTQKERDATQDEIADIESRKQFSIDEPTFESLIQNHLDDNAKRLGYDSILSAASYDGDKTPVFAEQGRKMKAWRSDVWVRAFEIAASIKNGEFNPSSEKDIINKLPSCPL